MKYLCTFLCLQKKKTFPWLRWRRGKSWAQRQACLFLLQALLSSRKATQRALSRKYLKKLRREHGSIKKDGWHGTERAETESKAGSCKGYCRIYFSGSCKG